jgi:hypothetical protein
VEQLDEHNFLVTVREDELPFSLDDMDDYGMKQPTTLSGLSWWLEWKERQMVAETKTAIMRQTHVGELLRSLPKHSSRKFGLFMETPERYGRLGFRVHLRDKGHVALFKMACC